ncbi:UDP-3-O-glucosamine N-acyltransferase [Pholiota molesta]|nr:UDP-3-O-glucosamine N-acyltransferase [Pholiota molesta]
MDLDNVKTDSAPGSSSPSSSPALATSPLGPLTNDYGDAPCPKALLPVANKPLIEYTLDWLEKSGIKDVLLICPSGHRAAIHHHIHSETSSTLRIDLQTYDDSQDENIGTCDLLRQFSSRIPEDFVIVPCDFIPSPSIPLSHLLNKFRVESLAQHSLATSFWYVSPPPEKGTFIDEWGPPPAQFPIVWEPTAGTLLHIDTPDDADRNSEEIELKMSMLSRFPRTKLSSSLDDSHVYVCRRAVLDLLQQKVHFSSLREEFLPWLCKIQYSRSKRAKYALRESASQSLALDHSTLLDTTPFVDEDLPTPVNAESDTIFSKDLKIGLVVHKNVSDPPMRINTLQKFHEINRRLLSGATYALPVDPKDRSLIDHKAQISADSIVGESTQISERATIKRSVIGRHCTIGKMVKITGCVLLDHCVVEDGAKLDGCILGKSTQVGQKAELTRCVTQAGYEVSQGEIAKGEKLEVSDWMADPDTPVSQHQELQAD